LIIDAADAFYRAIIKDILLMSILLMMLLLLSRHCPFSLFVYFFFSPYRCLSIFDSRRLQTLPVASLIYDCHEARHDSSTARCYVAARDALKAFSARFS